MKIALFLAAALSISITNDSKAQVYGVGVGMHDSCGAFVSALKKNGPGEMWVTSKGNQYATMSYLYMTWVEGFVTAENTYRDKESQIRVDRDGKAGWLKNYCEKNPAQTVSQATLAMINAM